MKKALSLLLSLSLALGTCVCVSANDLNNFKQERIYSGIFDDVKSTDWFCDAVSETYEYGIADGYSENEFAPYEPVSQSQAIAFGAKINAIYSENTIDTSEDDENWYDAYIEYALNEGIIENGVFSEKNYSKPATRAQVAYILARSVDFSDLKNINTSVSVLPDVSAYDEFYNEIIMLYRAGVLAGKDETGRFYPNEYITRAEVCAIINRIINKDARMSLDLKSEEITTEPQIEKYDAVAVASKAASAVFYIEIYDRYGNASKSGSGFFISADGRAVTNYHVIEDGYSAKIKLNDSEVYDVASVIGYDKERDIAVLQIDASGFNYLELADSDAIAAGENVFCIGSPLGLDNTISTGVVSNTNRIDSNLSYIQITAPISSGSSGGAVLDEQCKVIGISCGGYTEGQNLNLAIPINALSDVALDKNITLYELATGKKQEQSDDVSTGFEIAGYSDNGAILDFGKFLGISQSAEPVYKSQIVTRSYVSDADSVNEYISVLYQLGFYRQRTSQRNGDITMIFVSRTDALSLSYDLYTGKTCISYYYEK